MLLKTELWDSCQGHFAESLSQPAHRHHLSCLKNSSPWGISLGECNNLNLPTPCGPAMPSSWTVEESAAWVPGTEVWVDSGVSETKLCDFGAGSIPPSHESDRHHPVTRDPLPSPSPLQADLPYMSQALKVIWAESRGDCVVWL